MKNIYAKTATLVLATLLSVPALAVESGQVAPEFNLPGRSSSIKLGDFKGKTVYLDFWASWCGPCRQSFPWMNDMQTRYGDKGLRIVGVNVDQNSNDAKAFLKSNPASFDVAFDPDGNTPRAYGVMGMPTSILIGPDGKVLMVHSGFRSEERSELERLIKASLNIKGQ
jgi:thiol-disulfide isomerase/thioredoxin